MNQTNDTNKRIAEASGLFDLYLKPQIQGDDILHCFSKTPRTGFYRWMGSDIFHGPVPNYTESLDAMAEAERWLEQETGASSVNCLIRDYWLTLMEMMNPGVELWDNGTFLGKWSHAIKVGGATAAQRAAAFLAVVEGRGE